MPAMHPLLRSIHWQGMRRGQGMRCVGEGGVRVPGPAVQAVGQARMSVESAGKRRS